LREFPTEERYGLIWTAIDGRASLDMHQSMGAELDNELAAYDLDTYHHYRTSSFDMPFNWKLGVDTFLEVFHIAHLHRTTVAHLFMANTGAYDQYGLNRRLTTVRKDFYDFVQNPEPPFGELKGLSMVYSLFPNSCLNWVMDHFELWSFFPDRTADNRCHVRCTMLIPDRPASDSAERHWSKTWDALISSVVNEDFASMTEIQRNIESGLVENFTFGRNEIALQRFHRDIYEIVNSKEVEA
jgi:phenylpropionate dioxygenase-like ring-hydroxylating dioxygenase large terminal subunit